MKDQTRVSSLDTRRGLYQRLPHLLLTTTILFLVLICGTNANDRDYGTHVYPGVSIPQGKVTHTFIDQDQNECLCRLRCQVLMDCKAFTLITNENGFLTCTLTTDIIELMDCDLDDWATTTFKTPPKHCTRDKVVHVPGVGHLDFPLKDCDGYDWNDSKKYCNLIGSDLYIPENQTQKEWTWNKLQEYFKGTPQFWVGQKEEASAALPIRCFTLVSGTLRIEDCNKRFWFICQK